MKKITLFVLALLVGICVMTIPGYAQSVKIGGVTGLNFNIYSGSDVPTTGSGIGFAVGVEGDIMFNQQIGILARIICYDNLAASISQTIQGTTVDDYYSIAYLTIDPMFKLKLKNSKFFFMAGPTLGINIESSVEEDQNGKKVGSANITQMSTRFGVKVGAGVDIPVGGGVYIAPEFTWAYGLTKVRTNTNWRIMSFFLGSAIKFDI
jgi:hypothetical protein